MDATLARARSAIDRFEKSLAEADQFSESLATEYYRLRRALATSFRTMSLDAVPRNDFRLAEVKGAIVAEMARLFEGRVDSRLFVIGGYTTPHPDIYALLAARLNTYVPAWRIRLLSADATHTERRTRELRDLGLSISTSEDDDGSLYKLESLDPDLRYAAAFQLRENAAKSRRIDDRSRGGIIELAEETADLPERGSKRG